jgi:hypothetical protein
LYRAGSSLFITRMDSGVNMSIPIRYILMSCVKCVRLECRRDFVPRMAVSKGNIQTIQLISNIEFTKHLKSLKYAAVMIAEPTKRLVVADK